MLDRTFEQLFIPGSNLSGDRATMDWRFLLPSLELDTVICMTRVTPAMLNNLTGIADRVIILTRNRLQEKAVRKQVSKCMNPGKISVERFTHILPFPDASVDLWILDSDSAAIFKRNRFWSEANRIMSLTGVFYFETKNLLRRLFLWLNLNLMHKNGWRVSNSFWVTPFRGEIRTAVPLNEPGMTEFFFTHVIHGQSKRKRLAGSLGILLNKLFVWEFIAPRRAHFVGRKHVESYTGNVPMYVKAIGDHHGLDFSGYKVALSARGKYNSNKAVLFLFKPGSQKAQYVIKMTRSPEFNRRLEHEYHILHSLKQNNRVPDGTVPTVCFQAYHNKQALVCQKAIQGTPFRTRTLATPDCPLAWSAMQWITLLGKNTAKRTPNQAIQAIQQLYKRFLEIYQLSPEHRSFLNDIITHFSHQATDMPTVLQHGDPGTWNIMVTDDDQVVFMDWESGENEGFPLFDLFYFIRTFGTWISRKNGEMDSLSSFTLHFINRSPLGDMLISQLQQYCYQVGVSVHLVEGLFYSCWMHRAIKEATRLAPERVHFGHFYRLLCHCIDRRYSYGLRSLFELEPKETFVERYIETEPKNLTVR